MPTDLFLKGGEKGELPLSGSRDAFKGMAEIGGRSPVSLETECAAQNRIYVLKRVNSWKIPNIAVEQDCPGDMIRCFALHHAF